MEFECIRYVKQDRFSVITLFRPKVLNAMNKQMWIDLMAALEDSGKDERIKALIITGHGRAFSTGADLKESKTRTPQAYRDYLEALQEASKKIICFEKPTIAAINGYALGSGYELALACDIRIASKNAQIGSPEASVSASVTGGAFRLLPQLVGPGKAKELLFTAQPIDGHEAERIGLVNKAVDADSLMAEAEAMAAAIAKNSPFSIKMMKKGLHMASGESSLEALMDFEVEACLACVATKERQDALNIFEKRKRSSDS